MDMFDEELAGMVSYTDETEPAQMPVMEQKAKPKSVEKPAAAAEESTETSKPTAYIRKRTDVQRIGSGLKWLLPCAGIAWILWMFWMDGLMAMEAAYPCILACGCIGFGGGLWNARV